MERLSFDAREFSLLADVVETCRKAEDWPVPFLLLDQLRDLLHADIVTFGLFDTTLEYVAFMRAIDPIDGAGDERETVIEARTNPFWATYWTLPGCAYPDVKNDYESVTLASDFGSRPARRARVPAGTPLAHMRGCLPGRSPGRHYRIVAWRYDGPDFGERDRLALTLLRPHIEKAYWSQVDANREPPPLTRRQLELLQWVREGLTNIQIAHRLDISEGTVRTHLNNIYERLGTSGRTAAVHAVFGPSQDWPLEA
jgi:DNA-binding CsgD family transcriptional regulator